jgi:hypothetical protein
MGHNFSAKGDQRRMKTPNPNRQQPTLTPQQQATLERAKKRRFAAIIAALDANNPIRDRALKANAIEPAPKRAALP